jgi:hypothetical protein
MNEFQVKSIFNLEVFQFGNERFGGSFQGIGLLPIFGAKHLVVQHCVGESYIFIPYRWWNVAPPNF